MLALSASFANQNILGTKTLIEFGVLKSKHQNSEVFAIQDERNLNEIESNRNHNTKVWSRALQNLNQNVNFEEVNALLDGMVISLPDTATREDLVLFGSVLFQIKNTKCFDLSVGDIQIFHRVSSSEKINFVLDIRKVTLNCNFDWEHDYGSGATGKGTLQTGDNSMKTTILLRSDDFQQFPPYKAVFTSCEANINVRDINFDGGVTGVIADVFSFAFVNGIETSMKEAMCQQMVSLASALDKSILQMSSFVESYHVEIPQQDRNPLFAQNLLAEQNQMEFLDLTDTSNQVGNWFIQVLTILSNALGNLQFDDKHPTKKDLGINIYFRENILDANALLIRTPAQLGLKNNGLFYSNINFPQTTAKVTEFAIDGLDSVKRFDKFDAISPQTIQTHLQWDVIELKINILFDSDPSKGNPTMIVESDLPHLIENVTISLKITNVLLRFSFLTAMEESQLFNIPFGAAFESGQFFRCILNAHHDIQSTQVEYREGTYAEPTIEGFIGEGLDNTLTDGASALYAIYIDSVMKAIPTYFATSVKAQLNNIITDYLNDPTKTDCPRYDDSSSNFVDFRDLFLDSENAIKVGASGKSPYGDRSSQFKATIGRTFSKPGAINDLVNPLIVEQSGIEGTYIFSGDLYNFRSENMEVRMYEARVNNLDSFGTPDEFLVPDKENPQMLRNQFSIGEEEPVHVSTKMTVVFKDNNNVDVQNELSIDLGLKQADIFFKILMNMEEKSLLQFPVEDLANIDCWLSTTPDLILDKNGIRQNDQTPNFAVQDFIFAFVRNMNLNIECISCSTPGIVELPNMIQLLKAAGVVREMLSRSLFVLEEIMNGEYVQTHLDRFITKAKLTCPHSDNFIVDFSFLPTYDAPSIPKFSDDSLQFTVLCAGIASQLTLAAIATNIDVNAGSLDPLSGELALQSLNIDRSKLIDLSENDDMIQKLWNGILQSIIIDELEQPAMRINHFMRYFILDDEKSYSFKTNEFTSPIAPGFNFRLDGINVQGLDSFLSTNVYNVIAPHTIQNHFRLNQLTLKLVFMIEDIPRHPSRRDLINRAEEVLVFLNVRDIDITFSLMLALDKDKTGDIQLGSLLDASMALPCILSNTYAANVTQVSINPGSLAKTRVEGFLTKEVSSILATAGDTIFGSYLKNMASAMQTVVRNEMNVLLEDYILKSRIKECAEYNIIGKTIDLRDLLLNPDDSKAVGGSGEMPHGDLFFRMRESIYNSLFSPNEKGHPRLNNAAVKLSQSIIVTPDNNFEMTLDDETELRITSVRFENLDNFAYPLQFLQPRDQTPYTLDNEISLGIEGKILKIWANMFVIVNEDGERTVNQVDVSVQVNTASIFLSFLAQVDEERFKKLHLRDFDDINCWIATIPPPISSREPTLSIESFKFLYDDFSLDMECLSCPNQDINSASALGMIFNNPRTLARFLDKIISGPVLQGRINAAQHESTLNCGIRTGAIESSTLNPNIQQSGYIDESYKTMATFSLLAVLVIAIVLAFSIYNRIVVSRNHKKWIASLGDDAIILLYKREIYNQRKMKIFFNQSRPLISSFPILLRVCFILLTLMSLSSFAVSHALICIVVDMNGHLSTQDFNIDTRYNFSIFSFALDSWRSGSKLLTIFILIFSVISYLKIMLTVMIWRLPPSTLSFTKRSSFLTLLDTVGKWSMISIFLVTFYIISLQLSIVSPVELPTEFYHIQLHAIPYGKIFGANVLGQITSQICSSICIYYEQRLRSQMKDTIERKVENRNILENQTSSSSTEDFEVVDLNESISFESLSEHQFRLRGFYNGETMKVRNIVNYFIMVIAAVSMLLLFIGFWFPSIKISTLGLLGLVQEASNNFQDASTLYSLLSIVKVLTSDVMFQNGPSSAAGVVSMTALILFSTFVVPYIILGLLLCIWFFPMYRRQRNRLIKGVEILRSWEYLKVYIVSVFFASWQLDGISASMLGDQYCTSIRRAFISLYYYDVIGNTSINQCLYNRFSVEPAALSLILSSIFLTWLLHFILDAAAQKERDDFDMPANSKEIRDLIIDDYNIQSMMNRIKCNPVVQFSDIYGLLLRKSGTSKASSSQQSENEEDPPDLDQQPKEVEEGEDKLAVDLPSWATSWAPEDTQETIVYKADEHFL